MNCETLANHPNQEQLNNEVLSHLRTKSHKQSCGFLLQYMAVRTYLPAVYDVLQELDSLQEVYLEEYQPYGLQSLHTLLDITPEKWAYALAYFRAVDSAKKTLLTEFAEYEIAEPPFTFPAEQI